MKVAVIGCGSIGLRHARLLGDLGHDVVCYDPYEPARENAEAIDSVSKVLDSLTDLWRETPDAAFVTAVTKEHISLANAAADHGCHLFIEKPLSHSMDGIDDLQATLETMGRIAMVGCNMRFHPGPEKVKRLLDAGAIGEVESAAIHCASYLPDWRPHQDYRNSYSADPTSGGVILDVIHELDLVLWYLGPGALAQSRIEPATAIGLEVDGRAELILDHDCGATSKVLLSFIDKDISRGCTITGSDGSLRWDYGVGIVERLDPQGIVQERFVQPDGWTVDAMYDAELKHFFTAIETGIPPDNGIKEAMVTLAIALEARKG